MAKPRKILGLKRVGLATRNPFPGPRKLTGSKAQGIAFQNKFGRYLAGQVDAKRLQGKVYQDLWLMFEDKNGTGYAQPDIFILEEKRIVIFECKLSQNSQAWVQLDRLYKPLLEFLFKRPAIGIQVFQRMRHEEPNRPRISVHRELEFKDGAIWPFFPR